MRISGSANTGWYGGESDSVTSNDAFQIWDARFFVDAELGRDVRLGETPLVRDIGFVFEWDLVRLGSLQNRVGELYVDFQGLGDQDWANVQVGRFQIPVGENYLRFSQGYARQSVHLQHRRAVPGAGTKGSASTAAWARSAGSPR